MAETDIDVLKKLSELETRIKKLENPVIVEKLFPVTVFEEAKANTEV